MTKHDGADFPQASGTHVRPECRSREIVPPHEVLEVAPSCLEQLFILDIIYVGRTGRASKEREIGDKLPESQFGGVIAVL